jgi:hypothetical protein
MERSVHLVLLGPHTRVVASLCASCPTGPAGCCASPPELSWADIGRIASLAGAAWVALEMRKGHLRRGPRGLLLQRIEVEPYPRKCVYHGEHGCTVPPDRRSAACNYYVCGDVLASAGPEAVGAEAAWTAWMAQYATWDEILAAELGGWAGRPESADDDVRLFEHLGRRFLELSGQ